MREPVFAVSIFSYGKQINEQRSGTVKLGALRLVQYPDGFNPLLTPGAWWSDQAGGLIGAIGGSIIGCLGGLIGTFAGLGKARGLVVPICVGLIVFGVACLIAGVVALVASQPYAVYYPLKYFAELIGGDLVDVQFPAPPDEDPVYWQGFVPVEPVIAALPGSDDVRLSCSPPVYFPGELVAAGEVTSSASAVLNWSVPRSRENGEALFRHELTGYDVFYYTSDLTIWGYEPVRERLQTSLGIDDLAPGNYRFGVRAYDAKGLYSRLWPMVSKTID